MRRGSRISLYAAAILLCAAGVAMSAIGEVLEGRPQGGQPAASAGVTPGNTSRPDSIDVGSNLPPVSETTILTEDSSIYWVTRYTTCEHDKVRQEEPEPEFIGKTVAELAARYPDFKLETGDGIICMVRTVNQYCPDHYFIKCDDSGNIYVYRNTEGLDKLTMVMKLDFSIEAVPVDFQPLLREGMAFGSVEEIEGLIEDADS